MPAECPGRETGVSGPAGPQNPVFAHGDHDKNMTRRGFLARRAAYAPSARPVTVVWRGRSSAISSQRMRSS